MRQATVKKGALGFLKKLPARLIMLLLALMVLYPLFWNIMSSLKTNQEIMASPWALPEGLHIDNYVNAFEKANMGRYFLNSLFVVVLAVALLFLLAIPCTYALCRFRFIGSKLIFTMAIACIFIQESYILVPLFLQLQKVNMLDSLVALSVVYAVIRLPFTVFLLSGFIKGLPTDYEQAAMIDGCSYSGILWRIIVPLSKPGIVTAGLLAVLAYWNEYPVAMTFIMGEDKKTLPVGLVNLAEVQQYATDWGALFAAMVIVLVPTFIVYAFAQEKLTQGMSAGGIKG